MSHVVISTPTPTNHQSLYCIDTNHDLIITLVAVHVPKLLGKHSTFDPSPSKKTIPMQMYLGSKISNV
jgi:hypothetical protein